VHRGVRLDSRQPSSVARPRFEKKHEVEGSTQLGLPTPGAPAPAGATRVLPMDLKVGAHERISVKRATTKEGKR